MKLFNTLTRRKEEFVPLEEGKVRMYVCGPTVYNLIHIGNARPMIIFDTVRRYMEYKGYEVNYVSNFTDVDDKIIKKAIEEGVSAQEISERYIAECKKDMDGMNVKPATTNPQATQEIDGMISMIRLWLIRDMLIRQQTVLFISELRSSKNMANFRTRTWMICSPASVLCRYPVKTRKKIHWILFSGNRRKRENHPGLHHGVTDVRDGILSVLLWRKNTLAMRLISMQAEKI